MSDKKESIGKIKYFEPNNTLNNGKTVNIEDLSMFVDLSVRIPSRDKYKNENEMNTDRLIGGKKCYDYKGKPIDGTWLTTDYVEMSFTDIKNGAITNRELMGVESIDISFDPHFFPLVTMRIIDVRGMALMQPSDHKYYQERLEKKNQTKEDAEKSAQKAANVFFQSLFAFPYPVFTLTVKGYYGPIVSFDLRVTDFKSNLDSRSGNFICTVKFVGSMYGSLTEVPASYVLGAPYFDGRDGKTGEVWNSLYGENGIKFEDGLRIPTVLEMLEKYRNIGHQSGDEYIEAVGEDNESLEKLQKIHEKTADIATLTNLKKGIDNYNMFVEGGYGIIIKKEENNVHAYVNSSRYPIPTLKKFKGIIKGYENVKINDNLISPIVKDYISKILSNDIDETKYSLSCIDENKVNVYDYNSANAQDGNYNNTIGSSINFTPKFVFSEDELKKFGLNKTYGINVKFIDFIQRVTGKCAKIPYYDDISEYLKNQINELNKKLENEQNNSYTSAERLFSSIIGFIPTISNIYKILYAHLHVLRVHMNNCCALIEKNIDYRKVGDMSGDGYVYDDITESSDKIMAFPTITTKKKRNNEKEESIFAYPKNGTKFAAQPECKLVDMILKGITGYGEKLKTTIDDLKNTPEEIENSVNKTQFEATYPTDFFLEWTGGGPYDMSLKHCNHEDIKECAKELICIYVLRLLRNYRFGDGDALIDMKTFQEREAKNMIWANMEGVSTTKKYEILQYLTYMCKEENILNIFKERMGSEFVRVENGVYKFNKYINKITPPNDIYTKYDGYERFVIIANTTQVKEDVSKNDYSRRSLIEIFSSEYTTPTDYAKDCFKTQKSYGVKIYKNDIVIEDKLLKSEQISSLEKINDYETVKEIVFNGKFNKFNINDIKSINGVDGDKIEEYKKKLLLCNTFITNKENELPLKAFTLDSDEYKKGINIVDYRLGGSTVNPNPNMQKDGVYEVLLKEILRIGSNMWFNENMVNKTITLANGESISLNNKIPIYLKKDSKDGIFLSFITDKSKSFYFGLMDIFNEWVNAKCKNDGTVTIGENIKTMGFNYYFVKNEEGKFLPKRIENDTHIDNSPYGNMRVLMVLSNASSGSNLGYLKKVSDYKEIVNNGFIATLNNNDNIKNYNAFYEDVSKNDKDHEKKMGIYYSLKRLYERFIVADSDITYDLSKGEMNDEHAAFYDIKFYDSFQKDISKTFLVSFDNIISILDKYVSIERSPSFIELLAEIAQSNNMLFLAMPIGEMENPEQIFKTTQWWEKNKKLKNTFYVIQPGKPSEFLDVDENGLNNYCNDGYDIANNFSGETTNDNPLSGDHIMAFGVTYGMQNQNIFRNISVGMEKPTETAESLSNQVLLSQTGKEGAVLEKLNSRAQLFQTFANRSYDCTVEMMGNMGITPLMYFQLNNVPMFRGAYMITNVTHRITARDFSTTFKGTRQSKFGIPIPENTRILNDMLGIVKKLNNKTEDAKVNDENNVKTLSIIKNIYDNIDIKYTERGETTDELIKKLKSETKDGGGHNKLNGCNISLLKTLYSIVENASANGLKNCITITSSKRDEEGVSQHNRGYAVDIQVNKKDGSKDYENNFKLFALCCKYFKDKDFNQLIWENNHDDITYEMPRWIHIGAQEATKTKKEITAINASINKRHTPNNLRMLLQVKNNEKA